MGHPVTKCHRIDRAAEYFLMLWAELKDSNIPHCTMIHTCVEEVVTQHLKQLQDDMKASARNT